MIYGFLTIGTQIKNSKKRPSDIFLNMVLDNQIHIDQGEVFNGADDDGSGTIAILEIARKSIYKQDLRAKILETMVFTKIKP